METTQAPMSETLAASIIRYSEWNGQTPLYDPFCGSGTLLCEAFLSVTKTPSAYRRKKFGFERLPDFDEKLWAKVKNLADKKVQPVSNNLIQGSDIDLKVVETAKKNSAVIDPETGNKHFEGLCAHYSVFFVALCRVAGIPARGVCGFTTLS